MEQGGAGCHFPLDNEFPYGIIAIEKVPNGNGPLIVQQINRRTLLGVGGFSVDGMNEKDFIFVSLRYRGLDKPQLSKNHMQSLASSPLLWNAGAENIPLPCLLMAPDLL